MDDNQHSQDEKITSTPKLSYDKPAISRFIVDAIEIQGGNQTVTESNSGVLLGS